MYLGTIINPPGTSWYTFSLAVPASTYGTDRRTCYDMATSNPLNSEKTELE